MAHASRDEAKAAWGDYVGGEVVIAASLEHARATLLDLLAGDLAVCVAANATHDLLDAIERSGREARLCDVDHKLFPAPACDGGLLWAQPVAGMVGNERHLPGRTVVDLGGSLPAPEMVKALRSSALAAVVDLHLSPRPDRSGALVVFAPTAEGRALGEMVRAAVEKEPGPNPRRAVTQARRFLDLAERQRDRVEASLRGMIEAAGVPCPEPAVLLDGLVVPDGVPFHVPDHVDPATFFAYILREQTPIRWLAADYPVHYRAYHAQNHGTARATGSTLAKWLGVPVGPNHTAEEIVHGVLGVVKAAEYLGVRWFTDPPRAAAYADMMTELYGPVHDAYRPSFEIPSGPL